MHKRMHKAFILRFVDVTHFASEGEAVERELPAFARERVRVWRRWSWIWWGIYYATGVSATLATITVAARPPLFNIEILAWFAAMLVALSNFMGAARRARSYQTAFRMMRLACIKYEADMELDAKYLASVVEEGWRGIAATDPADAPERRGE